MNRSYFKHTSSELFFFTDGVPESIEDAFVRAESRVARDGGSLSIYRPSTVAGPWDSTAVIGHRTRAEVLRDLAMELDDVESDRLDEELDAIHECFRSVGRTVPLMAVAA